MFVLIRIPSVQNYAKNKAVNYLEGKIGTKVEINKISLDLPKLLVLEDIYFEDQKKDTLLAGDTLKVDISLLKLLHNELEINEIDLRGITTYIQRTPDSVFNFDYIVKAFAGEQKKQPKPEDTTSTMKFSVGRINLDRIRVGYRDAITANDVSFYLGHFDTRIKDFDLDKMNFNIPKINLSGVNARLLQSKPAAEPESDTKDSVEAAQPVNIGLKLGEINLDRIHVDYENQVSAMKADVNLGKLVVEANQIDLKKQSINLEQVNLEQSDILFQLGKTQQAKVVAHEAGKEVEVQANNWRVALNNIQFKNNNIRFDNFNMPVLKRGLDYAHLNIKNLNLEAENILYAIDTISGNIASGSFSDKSGFALKKLHTDFFYGKTQAYLNNLEIATNGTVIKNQIRLNYPSIESLSKNPGELRVDANLNGSKLNFHDVLLLVPSLAGTNPFKDNPNATLFINGKVNGQVKNLNIPSIELSGFRNTHVKGAAKIKGLPDVNKAYFDVRIDDLTTQSSDLLTFVPAGTIPANIRLPQALQLQGTFKGGISNFTTNLNLHSSYGSARTIASYNASRKGHESYKATVNLFNFDVGRLIKQEKTVGRVTLAAKVNGVGTDPKTMRADFAARVIKAEYNRYAYRNLNMTGKASNGIITAKAAMKDPNITFGMNALASFKNKYPSVKLALDMDSINLKNLNFATEEFRFHGKLRADLPTADPDYLNGRILLTEPLLVRSGERFQLDTISLVSTANADSNTLKLRSEFLRADVSGKYKLTEVGTAMQDLINRYFSTTTATAKPAKYSPQRLKFNVLLINAPVLSKLLPDLKEMANVTLTGSFNSSDSSLVVNGSVPKIVYGSNTVNNLQLRINTGDNALNYNATLTQAGNAQFQLINTSISGKAQNNMLTTTIAVKDKDKKDHYRIAGVLKALPDAYQFSLAPNGLLLNYQAWTVAEGNAIQFGANGIEARNFAISNSNQRLSIDTQPPGLNNPLVVALDNFKIETLTKIAQKDSLLIGGTMNGKATVSNLQASPVFVADMTVDNFSFRGDTVGNIALKVNNQQANTYAANVTITGQGNNLNLTGDYNTGSSTMDMTLNIDNLNLKSIEGFTFGNLKQTSGAINGRLTIRGSASAPQVRGDIRFNKAAFNIAMLNSYFRVNDNTINFNDEGIKFNNFTLLDSAGNKASVNGMVYTQNFTDYRFGLNVRTNNFRALNSTAKDNELYYGQVYLDSRINIKGDLNKPVIDGTIKINDKSKLTVVLPENDPGIEEREGIVEFVDMDNPELALALKDVRDTVSKSAVTGLDLSANIEIDKGAEFNIIIDQGNGDFLRVKGEAQLVAGIDPSGQISLTGTYELEEGAYELSFNFLKRRFDIKKGSTITWTGEPTTANVDVTAIYRTETAPLDLVENQLGDASQSVKNTYKQKLPFEVNLNMKGELMKPIITFDIDLPDKSYNVSQDIITNVNTRLDQLKEEPSELNKQVFALLLLNRFISENPFESSTSTSAESLARQSVSKILSEQLNNLAGDLIEGVDLDIGLESSDDYTTGERKNRTDLNVGISKRLLNDRLKVSVGSNFELEGPQQAGQKTSNFAGDISVEYQLSKDGRYLLRAYQKNEYETVLQGQVIETGLGFVITADYNKLKEIFTSPEERRRRRALKRQEKAAKADE
ncbi:translocation/assembly module TamB [Pedobacter sp. BS3]|nr:translocation/assembly module TamB [Pedobacter sp. BS3]